jgi:hypothetical protein
MTVLLTPIAIVLGPSAADSNARTGTALPINLSHRECRPFQFGRLTQSRRTPLEHRPRAQTNRRPLAGANPAPDRYRHRALVTIPIAPNLSRLRSIRLL